VRPGHAWLVHCLVSHNFRGGRMHSVALQAAMSL
jgi:hypothetical protein